MPVALHPLIDKGFKKGSKTFAGGTLRCHCASDPVTVVISTQVAHNHACGCTKCWKPKGAMFSIVAVAPHDKVKVTSGAKKLKIVDESALIQRHACTGCGVHMLGPVTRKGHAFAGLDFVHVELSADKGWQEPQFAAFVSSVIESGTPPAKMKGIRKRLSELGLEPYDCLSPGLMDVLATQAAKASGVLKG
jgi:S-(hydroxymethyl)glutathione synthase